MVKPFRFARLPQIIFKAGGLNELPSLISSFGRNVVLVTGKTSFVNSGKAELLFEALNTRGISYQKVIISGEPSPEDIDENVSRLSSGKFDCIAGIGGGSVLDAGKAIAAMMYLKESVAEFLEGVGSGEHPGTTLPYIAVPTTSGTGSEATKNAVISKVGKDGFKRSLRHDNFVPKIAIVDPELTVGCPADITAASGMDCFSQLTEAFLSDKSSPYTDALALEGLKEIKSSLPACYKDGSDIQARSGMAFAALTSGICLANAGLGVVHGFASSLGGRYDIPHGVICGSLMAPANLITVRKLRKQSKRSPALGKYALLGEIFCDVQGKSEDHKIDSFIEYLRRLSGELHLPHLSEAGVKEKDLPEIAVNTDCKNNPVKLSTEELLEILKLRNR
jgi:alcohol dehydrogenase class IV